MAEEKDKWWDEVPEDCVPVHAIQIIAYLNPDGKEMFLVNAKGSTALSTSLGLLELAKLKLVKFLEDK